MPALDAAARERLERGFEALLSGISAAWPHDPEIDFAREYALDHGEYEEALDLLLAIGRHNGVGFTPDQARLAADLGAEMGLAVSPSTPPSPGAG